MESNLTEKELELKKMKTKTIALLALILASFLSLNAQTPSSCIVPAVLQNYYDVDVKHIALKRIFDQNSPAKDSITIPQSYQDTVWEAMAATFNLTDFPARDTVFDIYCIHQYENSYIYYNIYVELESTCSWLHNWENLITQTGVPALDALISKYGFTVTEYMPTVNVAILTTNQTINAVPFCDSIETFNGVSSSDPDALPGFGDEIDYSTTGTTRLIDFVIGYGDCPCGCTGFCTYHFQVNEDCSVQYSGSSLIPAPDYDFPSPVNCNITQGFIEKIKTNVFRIYPTLVGNDLTIESENLTLANYSIINSFGILMQAGQIMKKKTISVGDFSPGLYLVLVKDITNQGKDVFKIIKE